MTRHFPVLDDRTLTRLRALVRTMHAGDGSGVPMPQLVSLAENVPLPGGVTIDFQASRELGQPMIVLRLADRHTDAFVAKLSRRERQIAALVAAGLSNKQIARRLFIGLPTVKDHIHRILSKTGLPNRAAVAAAVSRMHPSPAPLEPEQKGSRR